jgi:HD-GYP domain-containing protein (c-di-GMP phosphodiesterase class II)
VISTRYPFITRIAIALYDAKTDLLKTYVHSSRGNIPLAHYQAPLSGSRSLQEILTLGRPRVVNDLSIFQPATHEHTRRLADLGYQSSYTQALYQKGTFIGFLFFNSTEKGVFTDEVLHNLDLFGHLLSLSVVHELATSQVLVAALNTVKEISQHRDSETGGHLDRMSRYSRLIARTLADEYDLSDEFVEQIFMYSPLHDIGKIAIPDNILLKQGALTPEEYAMMQSHTIKGRHMIDAMLDYFGMGDLDGIEMLRNIAELHHEMLSGKGYPHGLKDDEIPLEARVIAVADVFDALTSRRPYKEAWSNEKAVAKLRELAGSQLDRDCVAALIENMAEVEQIQALFTEDLFG